MVANPRTHPECRTFRGEHHDWQPWRREGWLDIHRCSKCGRNDIRDMRVKGLKECWVCQKPLVGRKINWCGDSACWMRKAAYSSPTSWSSYIHWKGPQHCADCGVVDKPLEAHHIHPVAEGGIELDPDNGVLLCVDCHLGRHKKRRTV